MAEIYPTVLHLIVFVLAIFVGYYVPRIAWTRTLTMAWEGKETVKSHLSAARSSSTAAELAATRQSEAADQSEADCVLTRALRCVLVPHRLVGANPDLVARRTCPSRPSCLRSRSVSTASRRPFLHDPDALSKRPKTLSQRR
jgi:hypothetical protein